MIRIFETILPVLTYISPISTFTCNETLSPKRTTAEEMKSKN